MLPLWQTKLLARHAGQERLKGTANIDQCKAGASILEAYPDM